MTRQNPEKIACLLFFLAFSSSVLIFLDPSSLPVAGKGKKDWPNGRRPWRGVQVKVQEAAFRLLTEEGRPLSSRELARRALERGMVTSAAGDPVFSIASTIEKTIRDGRYNRPELVFVPSTSGRRVGLPSWKPRSVPATAERRMVSVQIPADLAEKITLAAHARLAPTFEATTALLLRRGLAAAAPEIRRAVMRQLEALERHAS